MNLTKDAAEKLLIDAMSGSISAQFSAQALWYAERQRGCPKSVRDDLERWNNSLGRAVDQLDRRPSELLGDTRFKAVMKYHAIED